MSSNPSGSTTTSSTAPSTRGTPTSRRRRLPRYPGAAARRRAWSFPGCNRRPLVTTGRSWSAMRLSTARPPTTAAPTRHSSPPPAWVRRQGCHPGLRVHRSSAKRARATAQPASPSPRENRKQADHGLPGDGLRHHRWKRSPRHHWQHPQSHQRPRAHERRPGHLPRERAERGGLRPVQRHLECGDSPGLDEQVSLYCPAVMRRSVPGGYDHAAGPGDMCPRDRRRWC